MSSVKALGVASAAALLLMSLASCGGDDDGSGSPETHRVMAIGPFPGPDFSFPGMRYGLEAAVEHVNENGGIGRSHEELEVIACNTQADPNLEAQCVRQAIDEDVVAIIGGFTLTPNVATPALAEAGIPWLAYTASAPDQFAAPTGFPLVVGNALYVAAGMAAVEDGCENPAILTAAVPASEYFDPAIEAGIEVAGGEPGASVSIPATATEFAPSIAQAIDADADCVVANVPPALITPFMTAVQASGADLPVYGNSGVFTPDQIAADPELFEAVTVTAMTPPIDDSADIAEFQAVVRDYHPDSFEEDQLNYLQQWLGIEMLHQAAANLDEISAETVLEAMRTTEFDLGFGYPTMEFSTPVNDSTYQGVYLTEVFVERLVDGVFRVERTVDTEDGLLTLD